MLPGVAIILLTLIKSVHSADVGGSTGILAYTLDSTCPTDWSDLSTQATYNGRYIKGTESNFGGITGTALADGSVHMHTHAAWSQSITYGDSSGQWTMLQSEAKTVKAFSTFTFGTQRVGVKEPQDSALMDSTASMSSVNPEIPRKYKKRRQNFKSLKCTNSFGHFPACRCKPSFVSLHWGSCTQSSSKHCGIYAP